MSKRVGYTDDNAATGLCMNLF